MHGWVATLLQFATRSEVGKAIKWRDLAPFVGNHLPKLYPVLKCVRVDFSLLVIRFTCVYRYDPSWFLTSDFIF